MFNFKKKIGNQAEKLALQYLQDQGLKLVKKNYTTKLGEIDIIMLEEFSSSIVFVEVRYRKSNFHGKALETVNYHKQQKIIKTARIFLQNSMYDNFDCRFDVVALNQDLQYNKIQWVKNAFNA